MHNDSNNDADNVAGNVSDLSDGTRAAWQAFTGDPEDATRQPLNEHPNPYVDRAGATTASASAGEDTLGIMPDDLPMIVWLRGDEPWFEDFSVDADTAMAELGIRRSRLTQISGRELRVGKKRVDRYIRPCFRPEDLAAYKNFTRATASHLKSAAVLDDVLGKLEHESSQILERITAAVRNNSTDFASTLEQNASELRQTQGRLLREVSDRLDIIEREMHGSVQAALQRSTSAATALATETAELRQIFSQQCEKMIALLNQNQLLLREVNAAQSARFETLGHQIASQLGQSVTGIIATAGQEVTTQIEQTVHQTRLAIRGDLKKMKELLDEKFTDENSTIEKLLVAARTPSPARWRRPVGHRSGYHSRRLRY